MASKLTTCFEEALIFATQLHTHQTRKGSQTPYIAHLLSVTALVIESGGDEDTVIAALLHDAVEDQGGLDTLAEIRQRFGKRVAEIVDSCSDADTSPKPPWKERKEAYLNHLTKATPEARLVSMADKLHNARSILRDLRQGKNIWEKFNGGKEGTLWYYTSLVHIFRETDKGYLVNELDLVVQEIHKLAKNPGNNKDGRIYT
jgi:(p)ppGpp synthase/HD superfamily hydrolase